MEIKEKIKKLVSEYYREVHARKEPFEPGKTYLRYAGRVFDDDEMHHLTEAMLDFWLTPGHFAEEFEKKLSALIGVKHGVLVNSGSSANLVAISALTSPKLKDRALKPGDEVITAACAFPTTVNPVFQNNLVPVFVDIELPTYNVSPAAIESVLTPKTKAVILAHTMGNPFEAGAIADLCRRKKLWLVEDNCDALGSLHHGRMTGSFGDFSTYSFYPPHHITMGEGGAVLTDNPLLKTLAESFRDWGRDCWCKPGAENTCGKRFDWQLGDLPRGYDHKYIWAHVGYNLNATDMQAAIGVAQLKKLGRFTRARRKNWQALRDGLSVLEEHFILPEPTEGSEPSWFGFLLTLRNGAKVTRNDLVRHLEGEKIATRMLFSGNLVCHPSLQGRTYRVNGRLRTTDKVMNDTFWVGVYPGLGETEMAYIIHQLREAFR